MVNRNSPVLVKIKNRILFLTLNRPRRGNSINADTAKSITRILRRYRNKKNIDLIFFQSKGKNFCTGADLEWMLNAQHMSDAENEKDMLHLVEMYYAFIETPKPLLIRVHGRVMGGGMGLVSLGDFVMCDANSSFQLPEKSLGLIPGIITPLIKNKIGSKQFSRLANTGKKISAQKALSIGLVNVIARPSRGSIKKKELIDYGKKSARLRKGRKFLEKARRILA